MSFFRIFFRRAAAAALPSYPTHMGAGCVFTDGKHVLAGYQPHKKKPGLTGIGGHREGEETYLQTAYRETIEELFHVSSVTIPVGLVDTLSRTLRPKKIKNKKGYVLITLDFQDLEQFLTICKKAGLRSSLYTRFPRTLLEVLQMRGYHVNAEIASLALLPVIKNHRKLRDFVDPLFLQDMWDM